MSDGNTNVDEEIIVVGDKVDLVTKTGAVYRTMIEDRLDSGPFLAGIPNKKGIYMNVNQDDDIYLVFYRESGRFIAHMKVVGLERRGELRYMWLVQKTRAQKNQRRGAFRLAVSFDVFIFELPAEDKKDVDIIFDEEDTPAIEVANCRDLSITGIALLTMKTYELGDKYVLSLHMDRAPANIRHKPATAHMPTMHLTATVRRCVPWRTGRTFNTGMQFFGMTDTMSEGLAKYVLNEQQKQIKRRRMLI